jgi:hypothetical protein
MHRYIHRERALQMKKRELEKQFYKTEKQRNRETEKQRNRETEKQRKRKEKESG